MPLVRHQHSEAGPTKCKIRVSSGSREGRTDQPGGGKRGLNGTGKWQSTQQALNGLGQDRTGQDRTASSGADRLESNAQHCIKWRWPREVRCPGEAEGLVE